MKKLNQKRQGFTLIELLIVVSIIGILSVALVPNLSGAPARARDAARKAMLSQVAAAIENYNIDKGVYPDGDDCVDDTPVPNSNLETLVDDYLNGVPPKENAVVITDVTIECPSNVHYTKLADGYVIFIPLELNKGGDYDIEVLDTYVNTDEASTVAGTQVADRGGNAHAVIR